MVLAMVVMANNSNLAADFFISVKSIGFSNQTVFLTHIVPTYKLCIVVFTYQTLPTYFQYFHHVHTCKLPSKSLAVIRVTNDKWNYIGMMPGKLIMAH